LAAVVVVWGARTDRRWTVPLAALLAMPTIWINSPTMLVAVLPLIAAGAATPAGRWLRESRQAADRSEPDAVGAPLTAPGS
jgi:hypothetical protein